MNRLRDRIWMRFRWPMSKGPFCFVTGNGRSFVFTLIGDKWADPLPKQAICDSVNRARGLQ